MHDAAVLQIELNDLEHRVGRVSRLQGVAQGIRQIVHKRRAEALGMQLPGLALLVIVVMGALTFLFIQLTWKPDRTSALLMLPYMAWVTFAGLINLAIWWMN